MKVLVTGAGGVAGVNFVRALCAARGMYDVVGADNNKYYLEFPNVSARYRTPRHDAPDFTAKVTQIARKEKVRFIHPQPSSEGLVLSRFRSRLPAPVFLPPPDVMETGQDKLLSQERLLEASVPVARTWALSRLDDLDEPFDELKPPLWVRARHGAGGRLSLPCGSVGEAKDWVSLWKKRGTRIDEFIVQEYLPGRNIAWDSIWEEGRLVTSYSRERIEYPFKHISPSGITGTPSVSRIVHDARVNRVGEESVKAVDPAPNGAYSVDLKEDSRGGPSVTEVDAGKFHTTMPLWGYVAVKHFHMPWWANLADLYVRLGLGEEPPSDAPRHNLLPADYFMIRNIDSGVLLWKEDGWKERVL